MKLTRILQVVIALLIVGLTTSCGVFGLSKDQIAQLQQYSNQMYFFAGGQKCSTQVSFDGSFSSLESADIIGAQVIMNAKGNDVEDLRLATSTGNQTYTLNKNIPSTSARTMLQTCILGIMRSVGVQSPPAAQSNPAPDNTSPQVDPSYNSPQVQQPQNDQNTGLPAFITDYVVKRPNNPPTGYGSDLNGAVAAVDNSYEGGQVVQMTMDGNGKIVNEIPIKDVPAFSRPKGPDGKDIPLASPSSPYVVNITTGAAYTTLQEAESDAKSKNDAADLHTYTRGVDQGTVESIPAFNLTVTDNGKQVPVSANDTYWVFSHEGVAAGFFKSLDEAIQAAKSYGGNGNFPGGDVTPYKRDFPQQNMPDTQAVHIAPWQCPQNLPNCSPFQIYYQRDNQAYPNKLSAIAAKPLDWLFGSASGKVTAAMRDKALQEVKPLNWSSKWLWVGLIILFVLYLLAKLPSKPDSKDKVKQVDNKPKDPVHSQAQKEASVSVVHAGFNILRAIVILMLAIALISGVIWIAWYINNAGDHGDFSFLSILGLVIVVVKLIDTLVRQFEEKIIHKLRSTS